MTQSEFPVREKPSARSSFDPVTRSLVWLAFGLAYLLFFVGSVFLSSHQMQFFEYLPAQGPIGLDLRQALDVSRAWLGGAGSPYLGTHIYTPLAGLLLAPFLVLDFPTAYGVLTLGNVLAYLILTLWLPLGLSRTRVLSPTFILVVATGLLSYGFQFELERGQLDLIAVLLSFAAIWIYHYRPRYRALSYLLFVLSVQLKLYAFCFVVLLIDDWRDWRNTGRRFALIVLANLALLFSLGPGVFGDFLHSIRYHQAAAAYTSNHSSWSFTHLTLQYLSKHDGRAWGAWGTPLQLAFVLVAAGCVAAIIVRCVRQGEKGPSLYLLLACTLMGLVIPTVSDDYTLSVLTAPVAALFLADVTLHYSGPIGLRVMQKAAVAALSFAYASTLFSFLSKPRFLSNNFPALLIMLLATTVLCWLRRDPAPVAESSASTVGEMPP